ncbi:MAG: RNA-guided endonuclease InsQ/TnpB family protein [Cyanophyceae cyanobacterium]
MRVTQKVRIYPEPEQQQLLAKAMGCCRWWWNRALKISNQTYKETGKSISRNGLNAWLPKLKQEFEWLGTDVYSQSLQQTTLNLSRAFLNFFEKRARYPRFKSKHGKQTVGFPQGVKIESNAIYLPKLGLVKAVFDRRYAGKVKTVTVTKDATERYFASILYEVEACFISSSQGNKILGVDLGIKDFAIVTDGTKTSKYSNPKHFKKHEQNLARKQKKLARKQLGSKTRAKAKKLAARVHTRISNARQDFLHKLSRKLTNESQVVAVENLNVKGMVRNHKLASAISDVGWGRLVNFLSYKLEREEKRLVEIDRWFPSSKTCSSCLYQLDKLSLDIREWTCPSCQTRHDRDSNAALNIRAEGIRLLKTEGTPVSASGGNVRPTRGRKTKTRQFPAKLETPASTK